MRELQFGSNFINLALIIVDMQNGFVSKGGSYDKLGMNIDNYQQIIPNIKRLISFCREEKIPIFYTEAIREPSGIDLLLNIHNILPRAREERLQNKKIPICMRDTWDAGIINDIEPTDEDHIILKRRDSAFQDTELRVWLQSIHVNTLIFCGIDTSICVETSLRDAFNLGYDVILVSDATASGNKKHYDTTIERVRDYYGVVISIDDLKKMVQTLEDLSEDEIQSTEEEKERISQFLEKHNLINVRREKM